MFRFDPVLTHFAAGPLVLCGLRGAFRFADVPG